MEYFINRLYVAVSRPKRRLFIVDAKDGRERLWKFATDSRVQGQVLQGMPDAEAWEGRVDGMSEGVLAHFDTEESTNLEEEAANLEAQGLSRNDAYLLRSAANRYRLVGLQAKVNYCIAEAFFADEKYLDAGRVFADCGHHARAIESFWRAGRVGDKLLLEAVAARPELQTRLECILAQFLESPRIYEAGYRALATFAERAGNVEEAVTFTSCSYWTEPVRRIAEKLVELGEKQKETPDWGALSALFERLDSAGFGLKKLLRARVSYLAGQWSNAVSFWEAVNDRTSKEYREAKARVAPYPEQLAYLRDLGKHDVILEAFSENPGIQLDSEAKRIVGMALASANRFDEALEQFTRGGAISEIADLAAAALANGDKSTAQKGLRLCFVLTVQQSHWGAVREYLNGRTLPRATKAAQKALALLLNENKTDIDCLLAACCARSDSLTKLESSEQKPISKFLRDLDRTDEWQTRLSVEELGSAIERSQRYVDAVEFYESALSAAENDEQKRFTITRWVKSKERLELFYRGEKQYRRADEVKEEIAKVKAKHHIEAAELALEYPELTSLIMLIDGELKRACVSIVTKPPTQENASEFREPTNPLPPAALPTLTQVQHHVRPDVDLILSQLRLRFSRENQRINLEHQTTSKTASIRLSPIRFASEDITWSASASVEGVHYCEEWGLDVNSSKLEGERLIVLRFAKLGVEIKLDVA
jgi:hypothetical protein